MKRLCILLATGIAISATAAEPEVIKLWPGEPPLAVAAGKPETELPLSQGMHPDITRIGHISEPTLTIYPAPKEGRTGTAVLICPGGGYSIVAFKHEGTQVAEWFNSIGVTAAVLKYRVPSPQGEAPHVRPLLDAQRAMSLLRKRAGEWDVDANRIGVLGFSAGGHLAAWLMCEGDRRHEAYPDAANEPSCRPDFGVLIYPAYLADTRPNRPAPEIRSDQKPGPAFLVHAHDDGLSPVNSVEMYLALQRAGVDAELHIFQKGGHGFGMIPHGNPINDWPQLCERWLKSAGLLGSR